MSFANKPLFKVPSPLRTKSSLITNDYDLSQKVLGVGINGKVLECFEKKTGKRFALKVFNIAGRPSFARYGKIQMEMPDFLAHYSDLPGDKNKPSPCCFVRNLHVNAGTVSTTIYLVFVILAFNLALLIAISFKMGNFLDCESACKFK